ncbi:MAG: hypothetical protein CO108_09990 [Deltaproteobacteria bacterium CG_4_9_14_3_um_filter_63_12]|nr:MAG: hypothetical protein CO108_09990 [Deltaproteobacteria bacterium CG_4_9_14_3_um_filter_63_12]
MAPTKSKTQERVRSAMLTLEAKTAREMMVPLGSTLRRETTIDACTAFLIEEGLHFAPVADANGQLVGVLSRIDVLRFERSCGRQVVSDEDRVWFAPGVDLDDLALIECAQNCVHEHTAADFMSADIQKVSLDSPAQVVVNALFENDVNQIYVLDEVGQLVGMIGMTEVLRHLTPG